MAKNEFKVVYDFCMKNRLGYSSLIVGELEKIDLNNEIEVNKALENIREYEDRIDNNPNRFSESTMMQLRQRRGLDKWDVSEDSEINSMSNSKVFEDLCGWNGLLGGWDDTIKSWIKDIYNIDLNEVNNESIK